MTKYKHIYFDLDRTLWDFDNNARETFIEIYNKRNLNSIFNSFDAFYNTYNKYNDLLWKDYRDGKIEKSELRWKRFALTLEEFGVIDNELAKHIGEDYVLISPTKKQLFPFTHETLSYLKEKYKLYIITNGFSEIQFIKLVNSNLDKYFTHVFTSEEAGAQKPSPIIFEHALKIANAEINECLMIGDDLETDILGARNMGIDQVYFNTDKVRHNEAITYEISSLNELKGFL
ncbi:MAG: noncanonical pyrimidine nucleotidase, YjjG family [Bacteroidetes bacterium GWF2_33_16]|nr:MAG: noncanonical pyrimidine nucleotidase, YjjG family [Bacteroidetes bacterium GWE2_32_14]OFY06822.1 MAG: noncanonical pyrimidine nucleotidase, YjjG family [Bacteroidetes bacterium GWF2_33_16]